MRAPRAMALLAAITSAAAPLRGQQLSAAERLQAVATIWAGARANYAGWDRVRADWDSALRATLLESAPRQTDLRFLRRLRAMTALLADPQAAVVAPALRPRLARVPLEIRRVEGRAVIIDYLETSEMRIARPERLAEVVSVQGMPADVWIRDSVLPEIGGVAEDDRRRRATEAMLDGERNTAVHITLRLPDGSTRGASVTRSVPQTDRWALSPPPLQVVHLPDTVVLVRLNSFADRGIPSRFDRLFRDWSGVTDLILDLRANGEGDSETGYQVLARLATAPMLTVRRRTLRHQPVELAPVTDDGLIGWTEAAPDTIQPRTDLPAFTGRVVVLVSGRTAGAAEDFVAAIRAAGRGVVIGEPTAGATGREVALPLPKGWRFHLTATRHLLPSGADLAGIALQPDIEVQETLRALREGTDAAVERARAYLAEQRRAGS